MSPPIGRGGDSSSQSQPVTVTADAATSGAEPSAVSELDLDALEKVARAATQAPWFRSGGRQDLYDGKRPVNGHGICLEGERQDVIAHVFFDKQTGEGFSDANHIATFDPPTVLKLITALRKAEGRQ